MSRARPDLSLNLLGQLALVIMAVVQSKDGHQSPLEVEHSETDIINNESSKESRAAWRRRPVVVVGRYAVLSTAAVVLALLCPGDTLLWRKKSTNGNIEFQTMEGVRLIGIYVVLWMAFVCVFRSNPGYLTPELLAGLSLEDGLSLLGYEGDSGKPQLENSESHEDGNNLDSTAKRRSNVASAPAAADASERTDSNDDAPDPLANSVSTTINNNNGGETYRGTRRKPCSVCQLAPPLRAHHCKICQRCVATFDHHCEFLGTCIGERNHGRFVLFLIVQAVGFFTCVRIVGSSRLGWSTLIFPSASSSNAVWPAALLVGLTKLYLYSLTTGAYIMLIAHMLLVLCNSTTFEWTVGPSKLDYLRNTELTDFVFSKGMFSNLLTACRLDDGCGCCQSSNDPSWAPNLWNPPGKIERDSEDWWNNPWKNKYWNCC